MMKRFWLWLVGLFKRRKSVPSGDALRGAFEEVFGDANSLLSQFTQRLYGVLEEQLKQEKKQEIPKPIEKKLETLGYVEPEKPKKERRRPAYGSGFFRFIGNIAPQQHGKGLRYEHRREARRRHSSRYPIWVDGEKVERWALR